MKAATGCPRGMDKGGQIRQNGPSFDPKVS